MFIPYKLNLFDIHLIMLIDFVFQHHLVIGNLLGRFFYFSVVVAFFPVKLLKPINTLSDFVVI